MHEDKKPIMQARDCEKVFASAFVQLVQVRRSVFSPNTQLSMSFFLDTNLLCALSTASLFCPCIALNQFNWRMMIQLTGSIYRSIEGHTNEKPSIKCYKYDIGYISKTSKNQRRVVQEFLVFDELMP